MSVSYETSEVVLMGGMVFGVHKANMEVKGTHACVTFGIRDKYDSEHVMNRHYLQCPTKASSHACCSKTEQVETS
jgi:hypothetical protein